MNFIQYLRPDGRKKEVSIACSPEIEAKAAQVAAWGGEFEVEVLTTGDVSLTCEYDDAEGERQSLAHEVCQNGPEVPKVVKRLVETAIAAIEGLR
jgi:hypothetical protein